MDIILGGWSPITDTWTYNSTDNPTGVINWTGANNKVSAGMRIRFDNGGNTIYGIVTAVTGSTMTFLHEMNEANNNAVNLMANSAITNAYVSAYKAPLGFNLNPNKWSVVVTNAITGGKIGPTNDTWYNLNSFSIDLPIGNWDVGYKGVGITAVLGTSMLFYATLSTTNDSETNAKMTSMGGFTAQIAASKEVNGSIYLTCRDYIEVAAKTVYYLNAKTTITTDYLRWRGTSVATTIWATCAYL